MAVVGGLLSLHLACTKDPPGEIVLSFQTDMSVPKDVSSVVLSITSTGRTLFEESYAVGPTGVKLPSTFGVVEGEKDDPITVRLIALKGTKPVVLREVVTKIPKGRVAGMKMPIEWLCYGESSVKGDIRVAAENQCPSGQTCSAGSCVPSDSFPLDDPYDAKAVFGGGDDRGQGGSCFATESCFASTKTVQVAPIDDGTTCSFTLDGVRNVALEPEDGTTGIGTGPNGGAPFLIPLDQGKSGFELQGSRVSLPRAVCARLLPKKAGDRGLRVYATRTCEPKTNRSPTCGPWSTVTKPAPIVDAGPSETGVATAWTEVGAVEPRFLRIGGPATARRLYYALADGSGTRIVSCDSASCSSEPPRCEAKVQQPVMGLALQQPDGNTSVKGIFVVTAAGNLEATEATGACAQTKPVVNAPANVIDVAAVPSELFLLTGTSLSQCSTTGLDCASPNILVPLAPPDSIGGLHVAGSIAYFHGNQVGGCATGRCDTKTGKDVRDDAGTPTRPIAITTLPGNYFWLETRGALTVVRDCPNQGNCGGLDLTQPGEFAALGTNDRYVYLASINGLVRAPRPQGPPGTPATAQPIGPPTSPAGEVLVDGTFVYYTTIDAVRRYVEQ